MIICIYTHLLEGATPVAVCSCCHLLQCLLIIAISVQGHSQLCIVIIQLLMLIILQENVETNV